MIAAAAMLSIAGCGGGGKDRSFELPPGTEFDVNPSDRVLVVVEASNQCEDGNCAATPVPAPTPADGTGGCDVGRGNTRGLAIYRLGQNGLLFAASAPEQTIATADNPRRLIVNPNDPSLVYVATLQRIQVFRLAAGGASRCIDQTLSEQEADPKVENDLDPIDLAIDPTIGNGILYVASSGANRIDAYTIEPDGTLPDVPTSCVVGASFEEYSAVATASANFVVAAGQSRIEVFRRIDGQFPPPTPESSATTTPSPDAATTPFPSPAATPIPSPSPAPTCIGATVITEPVSAIGAAIVTDMLFAETPDVPLGQVFVAEEVSRRLFTFPVDALGTLDGDDTSRTKSDGVPQNLLRRERNGQSILYVSVFREGRVDAYLLENGLLPQGTFSRTAEDPDALPVGMVTDGADGDVLYVAQGGLGRVDGFRIEADGSLNALPDTSTPPILTADGRILDTFPNDVAIVPLP